MRPRVRSETVAISLSQPQSLKPTGRCGHKRERFQSSGITTKEQTMVMIIEGPIRSSMYESVGTPTGSMQRTETAESATDGPARVLGAAFDAEPYRSLLEDPEIAGWTREWSERHN